MKTVWLTVLMAIMTCGAAWAQQAPVVPQSLAVQTFRSGRLQVLLKAMFSEMVEQKNPSRIPLYYDKDFVLTSNQQVMDYQAFLKSHENLYKSPLQYRVRYDDSSWVEAGNKLAGRLWIRTQRPKEPAHEVEVVLIVQYQKDKISRMWELTYPDWSKLPAFKQAVPASPAE